jgi:hypothetical protein
VNGGVFIQGAAVQDDAATRTRPLTASSTTTRDKKQPGKNTNNKSEKENRRRVVQLEEGHFWNLIFILIDFLKMN